MARNGHDGELALQAAESALREGERIIASGGFDPAAPGFYAGAVFGAPEPWSRPETWRGANSRVATPLAGVAQPPRFIVEQNRIVGGPRRRRGGIQGDRARHRRHAARARRAAERVRVVITRWRHGFRAETVHSAVVARTGGSLICGLIDRSWAIDRATFHVFHDAVTVAVPGVSDASLRVDDNLPREPGVAARRAIEKVPVLPIRQSTGSDHEVGPVAKGTPVEPFAFPQARHAAKKHVTAVEASVGVSVEKHQRAVVPGIGAGHTFLARGCPSRLLFSCEGCPLALLFSCEGCPLALPG